MSDYWTENGLVKPAEIIVCAANKLPNEVILCGARHWDHIMCAQADAMGVRGGDEEQGFINQFGEFRTREEAMQIVLKNGQRFDIDRNGGGDKYLFSEGLY